MKTNYFLFAILIIFLKFSDLNGQSNNLGTWDPIQRSFNGETKNSEEGFLFDSIGIWEQLGPANNDILCFDFGDNNANVIYAGSRHNGVYKTLNGGLNWQQMNNGVSDNFIRSIAVNPQDSNIVLAGTAYAGLFRSNDGGNTWNQIGDVDDLTILDIKFKANDGDTVYVATGGPWAQGVYRSWNGGIDWEYLTASIQGGALEILIDPNSSNKVYFTSSNTVYQSCDFGDTWNSFFISPDNRGVLSLAIEEGNSNTMYIGTFNTLYKSVDGGLHWETLIDSAGIVVEDIIISSDNEDVIYIGCPSQGVFKSEDGGNNWILLDSEGEQIEVISIKFHPKINSVIFAGTNEFALLRSGEITTSSLENRIDINPFIYCYPNPFIENTTIEYFVPEQFRNKQTELVIYNNSGNLVQSVLLNPSSMGINSFIFKRSTLTSGVYFYGLKLDNRIMFNKMIIFD